MRLHPRVRHALIAPTVLLALPSCDPKTVPVTPSPKIPAGVAMSLGGVEIKRSDIESWFPYFQEISPTTGRNSSIRYLLDRHLVPLLFAQREFASLRERQRDRANALAGALGNSAGYSELLERSRNLEGTEVLAETTRHDLPLVEARWLFDDANVGRVSPVLETAQGFSLVAAEEKAPGLTRAYDKASVVVVRFYTHKSTPFQAWKSTLTRRLGRLAKEARLVHPDFRDALPRWLMTH